jgi:hypothetical protein
VIAPHRGPNHTTSPERLFHDIERVGKLAELDRAPVRNRATLDITAASHHSKALAISSHSRSSGAVAGVRPA